MLYGVNALLDVYASGDIITVLAECGVVTEGTFACRKVTHDSAKRIILGDAIVCHSSNIKGFAKHFGKFSINQPVEVVWTNFNSEIMEIRQGKVKTLRLRKVAQEYIVFYELDTFPKVLFPEYKVSPMTSEMRKMLIAAQKHGI